MGNLKGLIHAINWLPTLAEMVDVKPRGKKLHDRSHPKLIDTNHIRKELILGTGRQIGSETRDINRSFVRIGQRYEQGSGSSCTVFD